MGASLARDPVGSVASNLARPGADSAPFAEPCGVLRRIGAQLDRERNGRERRPDRARESRHRPSPPPIDSLLAPWPRSSPSTAVHYDPARVAIGDVVAPPYDVIDAAGRTELLAALRPQRGRARPAADGRRQRPLRARRRARCRSGRRTASSSATPSRRSGPTSRTTPAPTATERTRRGLPRPDPRHRLRARARAPARAHPAGAEGGPPAPDPRDPHSMSPIFVLHAGRRLVADRRRARRRAAGPRQRDADGTVHRAWPIADPAVHDAGSPICSSPRSC